MLYNIPIFVGVNMEAETVGRLAEITNIVGVKDEAGVNPTQVTDFYLATKKADPDFLLGYIFHNITDAAFDETLHNPIWAAAGRAYGSAMSVNDAGWEESFRYDMSQREADWWKEIWPALAGARCRDFHTISGEQMGRHRDHLLTDYWDRPCQEPP